MVAAPLKLPEIGAVFQRIGCFRDQMVAAPLKSQKVPVHLVGVLHFRDQKVAAPLTPGGAPLSDIGHQIPDPDAECIGQGFQGPKSHVTFAAFDFADVSPVQASLVGEHVLGPASLFA